MKTESLINKYTDKWIIIKLFFKFWNDRNIVYKPGLMMVDLILVVTDVEVTTIIYDNNNQYRRAKCLSNDKSLATLKWYLK